MNESSALVVRCSLCALGEAASRAAPPTRIRLSLGLGVAAGVPALVLVSVGSVAGLAGPVSILIWPLSALVGLVMAAAFAELAAALPEQAGGVAVLGARVLRARSRRLALLAQWGYWLGWSPALAISAALVGGYVRTVVAPRSSPWLALVFATGVLVASAFVNHLGIRLCARLQVALVAAVVVPVSALAVLPLVRGRFHLARLAPFDAPGGALSWHGVEAIAGAFFVAGWSAYGAEIALTYAPEYRRMADTVRSLLATGAVAVALYALVPLALVGSFGVREISRDPAAVVASIAHGSAPIVVLLLAALVLTLNTIGASSSRVLFQMGRNGDAWGSLGRLNRHGAPRNALVFDVLANVGFIAVGLALDGGRVGAVPITLLTAASVGYFVSLVMALAAVHELRRRDGRKPAVAGLAAAAFNALLLAGAGPAWGWRNVGLGAAILGAFTILGPRATRAHAAPAPLRPRSSEV